MLNEKTRLARVGVRGVERARARGRVSEWAHAVLYQILFSSPNQI